MTILPGPKYTRCVRQGSRKGAFAYVFPNRRVNLHLDEPSGVGRPRSVKGDSAYRVMVRLDSKNVDAAVELARAAWEAVG